MEIYGAMMDIQFLITANKVWYSISWNISCRQIEPIKKKDSKVRKSIKKQERREKKQLVRQMDNVNVELSPKLLAVRTHGNRLNLLLKR